MFRRLGFDNLTIRKSSKSLGLISTQCSFFIWLHRDNKQWSNPDLIVPLQPRGDNKSNLSTVTKEDSSNLACSSSNPMKTGNYKKALDFTHLGGFKNIGNSCYASAILQVLSVLPRLWSKVPAESSSVSPIARSLGIIMSIKKRSSRSLDPSSFLWALKREMPSFKFHQQFDAHEVLLYVLNSVLSPTSISQDMVGCILKMET